MGNFCKFCGKELVNGQCSCDGFVLNNKTFQNVTENGVKLNQQIYQQNITQSSQQMYQQNMTQSNQQNMNNGQMSIQVPPLFFVIWDLIKKSILKPISTAFEMQMTNDNKIASFIIGGLHLFILLISFWIHIPVVGSFLEAGGRFEVGFILTLSVAVSVIIYSSITYLFAKKNNANTSFTKILSQFCVITVPGSVLYLISFIFGFTGGSLFIIPLVYTLILWLIGSFEIVQMNIIDDENKKLWIASLIFLAIIIVISLILKAMVNSILEDALVNLSSFRKYLF